MKKALWFDMDNTIAALYDVEGWLEDLIHERTRPYDMAKPMVNMALLARYLRKAQRKGYKVGVISWTAKGGNDFYNGEVALAKMAWLHKHLPSVVWDKIHIVPYGTDKRKTCGGGILFDDEEGNRTNWGEGAYTPDKILTVLKGVTK